MSLPRLRIIIIGQWERLRLIDHDARHHLLYSLARLMHLLSHPDSSSSSSSSSSSPSPSDMPLVLIESNKLMNEDEMKWFTHYKLRLQPVRSINNISDDQQDDHYHYHYRYQDDDDSSWITSYDNNLLNEWIICRRMRHHLAWCDHDDGLRMSHCSWSLLYHVTLSSSSVNVSQLDVILSHGLERGALLREQHEREEEQRQQQQQQRQQQQQWNLVLWNEHNDNTGLYTLF